MITTCFGRRSEDETQQSRGARKKRRDDVSFMVQLQAEGGTQSNADKFRVDFLHLSSVHHIANNEIHQTDENWYKHDPTTK